MLVEFPHSDICGLMDICSYPQLFAAYHVLLRLLVPRHSPYALSSLTFFIGYLSNFYGYFLALFLIGFLFFNTSYLLNCFLVLLVYLIF